MTKAIKPVTRETEVTIRDRGTRRPIVVTLKHGGMVLSFRLKGCRRPYSLPVEWCFWQAVEAAIQAEKDAKRAKKRRHP